MAGGQSPRLHPARILVVMGVSSSGKSTIGEALASELRLPFLDADTYHPPDNVAKMRAGIALTDEDRWPWLTRYAEALAGAAKRGGVVGACSALRRAYRDFLIERAGMPILFIHLEGDRQLIADRIAGRQHHYMPASLLDSQFATLQVPGPDENAVSVPVDGDVAEVVARIRREVAPVIGAVRPSAPPACRSP